MTFKTNILKKNDIDSCSHFIAGLKKSLEAAPCFFNIPLFKNCLQLIMVFQ